MIRVTRSGVWLRYSAGPMTRTILLAGWLLAALPLLGERVRVIVATEPPAAAGVRTIEAQRAGVIESLQTARGIERWGRSGAFVAELERWELELLRRDPRVRAITPDTGGSGSLLESIPLVGGDIVAARGFDGRDVTVAILDSGIDLTNPDFAGRIVAQQCFCDNFSLGCCPNRLSVQSGPGAAQDDNNHGTHVAGIIGGVGQSGPRGMAPGVKIVAVKVLDSSNSFASTTQIYRALEWIRDERPDVRVINMSLGTAVLFENEECQASAAAIGFQDVLAPLRARGVVIVASTGNNGDSARMQFPACAQSVLSVGATYDTAGPHRYFGCEDGNAARDAIACFSNASVGLDLLAPGAVIRSARRGGGSATMVGTSMAAPHVTGALALMMQVSYGMLPVDQAERILKSTGVPITDARNGLTTPRLDVAAAVAATPNATSKRRAAR